VQVEWYMSDENLARDGHLLSKMRHGMVALDVICGFPRVGRRGMLMTVVVMMMMMMMMMMMTVMMMMMMMMMG
jgi:hypothetical protein